LGVDAGIAQQSLFDLAVDMELLVATCTRAAGFVTIGLLVLTSECEYVPVSVPLPIVIEANPDDRASFEVPERETATSSREHEPCSDAT
jgi:hypothetical protein